MPSASSSPDASADVAFDTAIDAAEGYATAMGTFHQTLAEARLAHISGRMALEQRYADLSMCFVPTEHVASRVVVGEAGRLQVAAAAESVEANPGASSSDSSKKQPKDTSSSPKAGSPPPSVATAEGEAKLWLRDPATWFAAAPPSDVKACQTAFVRCAQAAIALANARAVALAKIAQAEQQQQE